MKLRILSLFFLCFIPSFARADESYRVAALSCKHNDFIVRFGLRWNSDPIAQAELQPVSPAMQSTWETMPAPVDHCTLNDGRQVSITIHYGQSFAYGQGGADPDAFFTIQIDQTRIYYHRAFYNGQGIGSYSLSAISYRNGELMECDASPTPQCTVQTHRLRGQGPSTSSELKALDKDKTRIDYARTNAPFCKAITKAKNIDFKYTAPLLSVAVGTLYKEQIDLDNNGVPDTVLRIGASSEDCCGSHYFDGSYLIVFYNNTGDPESTIKYLSTKDPGLLNTDQDRKKLETWGGHFISVSPAGSSARYVYNRPIYYKNHYYIRATELNEEKMPFSTISTVMPDHSLKVICRSVD